MANDLLADVLISTLADLGIRNIFTVPGGGAMYLVDAVAKSDALTGVCCHHEQTAAIAAEYSARTNIGANFGVCLVTSGPGSTNAITGLMGCWLESIPVLFLSGQAKSSDLVGSTGVRQVGVQEVDIISMVKSCTKYAKTWFPQDDFKNEFELAFQSMMSDRKGPVWIDLPLDVQSQKTDRTKFYDGLNLPNQIGACRNHDLSKVVDALQRSTRPLFYFGHGVRISGASNQAVNLVERTGIPFVTTWNAADIFPADYKLNMGRPGVVAERFANFAVQNCDLLICVGTRLNNVLTAYNPKNFAKLAKKIIVDIDKNELKNNVFPNAVLYECDALEFLAQLNDEISTKYVKKEWINTLSSWKNEFSLTKEISPNSYSEHMSHYEAISALSSAIPPSRKIISGSSGLAIEAFNIAFKNKKGQRVMHTSGLGSMGYAVPGAIGVAYEDNQNKPIYCVEGDGSLHMNLQDLKTLLQSRKKVCLIIFNNQGYASIRATQKGYFNERYLGTGTESGSSFLELEKVAELFGYLYFRADDFSSLANSILQFEDGNDSILVDVQTRKNESLFPKSSVYFDENGDMHSMPLEDMSPLLPLEVLEREMYFKLDHISSAARVKKIDK